MKINELSKPLTAKALNESLGKSFGTKLRLEAFTLEQLENARNKLRTQLADVETNESFETVHKSDAYQKGKLFLDTVNKEIEERAEWVSEGEDPKTGFTKWLKDNHGKGVRELKGNEYTKMSQDYQASKKQPVKEGAEESAQLVMAAKDMVDRVTGWMEDTAEMQTESMLELADAIRDEMGSEASEAFTATVKPALEAMYGVMETTRVALTSGVGQLTGEAEPMDAMGAEDPAMDPDADPAMEPTVDGEADPELAPGEVGMPDDGMGAADAAAGGEDLGGREKRESIQRSKKKLK